MRKFPGVIATIMVVFALILAACGGASPSPSAESIAPSAESMAPSEPESMAPSVEPIDYLVCMVSDVGGFDDASFNESGLNGLLRAVEELGVQEEHLQSEAQEDYDRNINQCISDGAKMVITVGFLLGEATQAAAEANPDVRFAIVDFAYDPAIPNVEGLVYSTAEAAMLAGYVSASWSTTGIMGTFGGINIGPGVTDFMDGFIAGMNYWNEQKGDDVRMLGGRDPSVASSGTFTGNFESTDDAKNFTIGMLQEGADVILPVGGPIGGGTFAAIEEQGADAVGLGVDADWCLTAPTTCNLTLVSIMKRIDNSVFGAIERAVNEEDPQAVYVSTLENGGVGLSPFHDYEDEISQETKDEIDALSEAIINGDISPSDYY
jgi:basic membrane protein A